MAFEVSGGIEGSGWLPGLTGENTFVCLARMGNILSMAQGVNVRCRHSTSVGNLINEEGEFESQESFLEEQEVDPKCYV